MDWCIPAKTKQYNNRVQTLTKLTPIQSCFKHNEGLVHQNILASETKQKFPVSDLVRIADLSETFSKGDRTNWSYILYEITEIINDTKPSYCIEYLNERYNESLLEKTELTVKRKSCYEKLNIT